MKPAPFERPCPPEAVCTASADGRLSRRRLLGGLAVAAPLTALPPQAAAQVFSYPTPTAYAPSSVIAWYRALGQAIAATFEQAPVAARAAAMLGEAIYNAWAAYDAVARCTVSGIAKRPYWEITVGAKQVAVSTAAHQVLVDLFPLQKTSFDALLAQHAPASLTSHWVWGANAVRTGRIAASMVQQYRWNDGSNQKGNLAAGAYADYTGYQPVNRYDQLNDPNRWQPLFVTTAQGVTGEQRFLNPQWGRVKPFALPYGSALRPALAPLAPTWAEMQELINLSAQLNPITKAQVDFWAANPGSVAPPGQWLQIAEVVARTDRHSLDSDAKLFFAVSQALLDASIAAWDAKVFYDSVRPITAIRHHFANQMIYSWGGPNLGPQYILGQNWHPYQRYIRSNPPFAEFPSGHSTFSAAAAQVMAGLRGDAITIVGSVPAGGIAFELNMPPTEVRFVWTSLSQAADAAGYSRRLGGIHFERGDLAGRLLGRQVGSLVLDKVRVLFRGW